MFLNKLASNSRQILSGKALPFGTAGVGARRGHVTVVPSRRPLSVGQQLGLGMLLFVSMWGIPFWILYRIPDYQNEERDKYTGR